MRDVLDLRCIENQNIFYVQKPFPENHVVCEIMWKNKVEPGTPVNNIIPLMRHACWITAATGTLPVHCNTGYSNTPEFYDVRYSPFFFFLLGLGG